MFVDYYRYISYVYIFIIYTLYTFIYYIKHIYIYQNTYSEHRDAFQQYQKCKTQEGQPTDLP